MSEEFSFWLMIDGGVFSSGRAITATTSMSTRSTISRSFMTRVRVTGLRGFFLAMVVYVCVRVR